MNIIAIIFSSIIVGFIIFLVVFFPNIAKTNTFKKPTNTSYINEMISQYNEYLSRCSDLFNKINNAINIKQREIIIKNDITASRILNNQVEKINEISSDINDTLNEAKYYVEKYEYELALKKINLLNEYLLKTENYLNIINSIKVESNVNYKEEKINFISKESSNEIDLFSNCNTLEDTDKRYKRLTVAFHPDNGGDKDTFDKLTKEYERKRKEFI